MIDCYTNPWMKATEIEEMTEGQTQYPTKGGAPVTLTKPYIVICGNKALEDTYPNCYPMLLVRFKQICLDTEDYIRYPHHRRIPNP